jgi:hypothetical protein
MNIVNLIIAYESGELTTEEQIELFARLIKSGMAWSLQGHYGRTAKYLIEIGAIDRDGIINWDNIATL